MIDLVWMLVGTGLILAGHCIRALRFGLLLNKADCKGRSSLLFALCLAYSANAVLPWRAGDVLRATYLRFARPPGSTMTAARAVAAVGAERLADLGIVIPLLLVMGALYPALIATAILVFALLLPILAGSSCRVRRTIWVMTVPFAHGVRLFVVDTVWSVRAILLSPVLRSPTFALLTLVMWCLYLAAYAALAKACLLGMADVVAAIHGSLLAPALAVPGTELLVLPLVLAPLFLLLALAPFRDTPRIRKVSMNVARRLGIGMHEWFDARFSDGATYKAFLLAHFAGEDEGAARFGLLSAGGDRAIVRRFLDGGSGAVTALVDVPSPDGSLEPRVRKFAMGVAAPRLGLQAEWLRSAVSSGMPATSVLAERSGDGWACYDMPYLAPCSDAYDAVHVMPRTDAFRLLTDILAAVRQRHSATLREGNEVMAMAYACDKVAANARIAMDIIRNGVGEQWTLNGEEYSLSDLEPLLDPAWTLARLPDFQVASIHGDLTLENVIVSPSHARGWFLIDPNSGGPFERPLMDMGKLMQSLHLGYESLSRRGDEVAILGDGFITVPLRRSEAYADLHAALEADVLAHDGQEGLVEARLHELVHYLRLVPYKARRSTVQGVAFATLAVMLMRRLG